MAKFIKLLSIRFSLLGLLIAPVLPSCEPPTDYRLEIANQSSQNWLYCIRLDDSLPDKCPFPYLFSSPEEYPEVSAHINGYRGGREELLIAGEERSLAAGNGTWDGTIRRSKNQALRLLLLSPDSVKHKGWELVRDKKLWGRKYNLTIDTLDKINWIVSIR